MESIHMNQLQMIMKIQTENTGFQIMIFNDI